MNQKDTLLVTVAIQDGENRYYENKMIKVKTESIPNPERDNHTLPCPAENFVIKEIYGQDVPYSSYDQSWDLGFGSGYPLVKVYSWYTVKPDHIDILMKYGIH